MKTLKQKMKSIGSARRKKVDARAADLIAEEMTLQELRQARRLTQVRMAKALASARMEFPVWKSAATFCFLHGGRASRQTLRAETRVS